MKNYEPKSMNAFQKQRAPHAVSDQSLSDLKEQMGDQGIFYRGATYHEESTSPETGIRQRIWFDKTSGKWIAEFHFPDDSTQRIEASSRPALSLAILAGLGQAVAEAQESYLEANPIFSSEWEETVHYWLTQCKFGREFSAWSEFLPADVVDRLAEMVRTRAYRLFRNGAKADARNIEAAYISLLDEGAFEGYERASRQNRKWQEENAAKKAEQERVTEERVATEEAGYNRALVEHEAIEAAERVAEEKKLARTPKGMRELRRRALFEAKQEHPFAVSTGTARRN